MPNRTLPPIVRRLRAQVAREAGRRTPDETRLAELRVQLAEEMAAVRAAELAVQTAPMSDSLRKRIADMLAPVPSSVDVQEAMVQ